MSTPSQLSIAVGFALAVAACGRSTTKPADQANSVPPPALVTSDHSAHGDHATEPPPSPATAPYRMNVTPTVPYEPGKPTPLTLELLAPGGARVRELEVVHEKLLHFIVVSTDLSYFSHEHPAQQPDGTFTHALGMLPHPGSYKVYGDFTPRGGARVVTEASLTVAGRSPPATPLVPVGLPAHATFGDFDVVFAANPAPVAGGATMLSFTVSTKGTPVTDLRDYLGARGHCVIISEDTTKFLHSHPLEGVSGAEVQFHTVFPGPGRYKVWAEFRPAGQPLIASFVIDVPPGSPGATGGHDMSMPMAMPMPTDQDRHTH